MNVETLKAYKLTLDEWNLIPGILAGHMTYERELAHVEMLVLAGLVSRDEPDRVPVLTNEGVDAARAIDMIFDWDDFAYVEGAESPSKALAEAATVELPAKPAGRPKPLSVGSLVRHVRTGGVGLIVEHTMWDADHGAFRVNFVKPVAMSDLTSQTIESILDRHDTFERV